MKSPVKYFGGKGSCFKQILQHWPKDDEYKVYIEPFGGSGAMLLSKPICGHIEIYNDIYDNVYSLFKVLSDKTLFDEFKSKCDIALYCAKSRNEFKLKLKDPNISMVERAYYYWYVNRTSHNGVGGFSVNTYVRRNMAKSTSDFLSSIDRMPELHNRLSSVIIEKRDALELIKKYNQFDAFFYCDPPYHQDTRGTARYAHDYTDEQHEQFIDCVLASKSKILISGYKCKQYNRLENKFKRIDFKVKVNDGNFKPKLETESLWRNF